MKATSPPPRQSNVPILAALAAPFLEAQMQQWNAWLRLQESLASFYKDLWEQWAVRFAGGAPLDG